MCQLAQATGEIQVHLQGMLRSSLDHKGPWLNRQQVVFPHETVPPVCGSPADSRTDADAPARSATIIIIERFSSRKAR